MSGSSGMANPARLGRVARHDPPRPSRGDHRLEANPPGPTGAGGFGTRGWTRVGYGMMTPPAPPPCLDGPLVASAGTSKSFVVVDFGRSAVVSYDGNRARADTSPALSALSGGADGSRPSIITIIGPPATPA